MFLKNTASQYIHAQMNSRVDGSPLTTAVSVAVAVDNAAQAAGLGTLTHVANGLWKYAPTQAETNGESVSFQFVHASGVNANVEVVTADATISSRSTYAGADTAGTTTLVTNYTAARATKLDNLDAAISTRTKPADTQAAVTTVTTTTNLTNAPTNGDLTATMKTSVATAAQTGLTAQGYTVTRAGYMDVLNGILAAIWAYATRTLTAFGFAVTANVDYVAMADAVWDEALAGHVTAGTAGNVLSTVGGGGVDPTLVAEAILKADWTTINGESARSLLNAGRALRNKVSIADNGDGTGTLTVMKEDDVTPAWTAIVNFDNAGRPISSADPV